MKVKCKTHGHVVKEEEVRPVTVFTAARWSAGQMSGGGHSPARKPPRSD